MAGRRWWRVRAALVLIAALGITLRVGAAAFALTPPITTPLRDDCNPCVTVVDVAAYDETTTVVDQAAYDETVTVVDTPATTGTTSVVDVSAHSVAHHDLVTPATTVARQVLATAGHYQTVAAFVPGHYERGPDQLVSQGYFQSIWISSGGYQNVWVSDGYWTSQWQSSGYWGSQWVSSGYAGPVWQPDYYVPFHCWGGPDGDCDGGYTQPGYWYTGWIDTSHYVSVWIDTSHWVSVYIDTSRYLSQWVDTSHWGQQWIDTSYLTPTQVWVPDRSVSAQTVVPAGYVRAGGCHYNPIIDDDACWTAYWVSTAYTATPTQAWVDPAYTTVYDPVPALYNDWTEQVAAVTHTVSYVIPAVTHQATVHHDAVTHTVVIHHEAVTHQAQAAVATSQSVQGADPVAGGAAATSSSTTPVTIPVVSTITLIDTPASTHTVTVVDRPAYDEQRTVVTKAAYDETISRPVWVDDCEDRCFHYVDHYDTATVHHDAVLGTETVHHDAVTHDVTTTDPAVTHTETLRYDAIVGSAGESNGSRDRNPDDALLAFAALMAITALANAGRLVSTGDALRATVAQWSLDGDPMPTALMGLVRDRAVTDTAASSAERLLADAVEGSSATQRHDAASIARGIAWPDAVLLVSPSPGGAGGSDDAETTGPCTDAKRAELLRKITEQMRLIDQKTSDIELDPRNLMSYDPEITKKWGTPESHQEPLAGYKRGLNNMLDDWDKSGCGDPPTGAREKALEPPPVPGSKKVTDDALAEAVTDPSILPDPGFVTLAPPYDPRADPANYDPINGIYLKDPDTVGTALKFMFGGLVLSAAVPVIAASSPLDVLAGLAAVAKNLFPEPAVAPSFLPDPGHFTTASRPAEPNDIPPTDLAPPASPATPPAASPPANDIPTIDLTSVGNSDVGTSTASVSADSTPTRGTCDAAASTGNPDPSTATASVALDDAAASYSIATDAFPIAA